MEPVRPPRPVPAAAAEGRRRRPCRRLPAMLERAVADRQLVVGAVWLILLRAARRRPGVVAGRRAARPRRARRSRLEPVLRTTRHLPTESLRRRPGGSGRMGSRRRWRRRTRVGPGAGCPRGLARACRAPRPTRLGAGRPSSSQRSSCSTARSHSSAHWLARRPTRTTAGRPFWRSSQLRSSGSRGWPRWCPVALPASAAPSLGESDLSWRSRSRTGSSPAARVPARAAGAGDATRGVRIGARVRRRRRDRRRACSGRWRSRSSSAPPS